MCFSIQLNRVTGKILRRKVVKATLGDVQNDKQSPFPSVKNRAREKEKDIHKYGRKV